MKPNLIHALDEHHLRTLDLMDAEAKFMVQALEDAGVYDIPVQPVSPYGVKAKSVATVEVTADTPLAPYEQQALKYLLYQVEAASPRVKAAFFAALAK